MQSPRTGGWASGEEHATMATGRSEIVSASKRRRARVFTASSMKHPHAKGKLRSGRGGERARRPELVEHERADDEDDAEQL